jgi:hypothetical protein
VSGLGWLPHSSAAPAELTSGLLRVEKLASRCLCLDPVASSHVLFGSAVLFPVEESQTIYGCGLPVNERMPSTLLLPAQEVSAERNDTNSFRDHTHKQGREISWCKTLAYVTRRCWAALPMKSRPPSSLYA